MVDTTRPKFLTVETDHLGLPVPRAERTMTDQANGIEPPRALAILPNTRRFTLRKKQHKKGK